MFLRAFVGLQVVQIFQMLRTQTEIRTARAIAVFTVFDFAGINSAKRTKWCFGDN